MTPEQAQKIIKLLEAINAKLGASPILTVLPQERKEASELLTWPIYTAAAPAPALGESFTMVIGAP